MRIISIFTIDPKKFGKEPSQMEVKDRDEAIALMKRFMEVAGDGTCTVHEVSTV